MLQLTLELVHERSLGHRHDAVAIRDDTELEAGVVNTSLVRSTWQIGQCKLFDVDPHDSNVWLLEANTVHVWHARVSALGQVLPLLARSLANDERKRVEGFFRAEDRERFVAAHGILRHVLGCYLKVRPEFLTFEKTGQGKPQLAADFAAPKIRFNLAHSGDVVALAFARETEVGIDVEEINARLDPLDLAQSQFSERELEGLRALSMDNLREAFFHCWARKEAYLKARGDGLFFALNRFAVSVEPGQPAALLWVDDDIAAAQTWRLHDLDLGAGYAAALALPDTRAEIAVRPWDRRWLCEGTANADVL
ncbi:MAG: 4'-phosphopantetheinyl transferase superfamily protein [Nibricoccus sp.]